MIMENKQINISKDRILPYLPIFILVVLALIGITFPNVLVKFEIPLALIICPFITWVIIKYDR